jgi:hypothetical protein
MYYLINNSREYEQSLQQARISLLESAFDQFWIQPQLSPLIKNKSSSSNFPTKRQSSVYNHIKSQFSIILLMIVTITLLLFSVPSIIRSQYHANRFRNRCSSLACISILHRIIKNLNLNINPCEDVYTYACGGWIDTQFLTPSETSISYFKEIYRNNLISLFETLNRSRKPKYILILV